MEILGIEKVDYVSKKTGRRVEGVTLYLAESIKAGAGDGVRVDNVFLSAAKLAALPEPLRVGDAVQVYYNKFGSAEAVLHDKL